MNVNRQMVHCNMTSEDSRPRIDIRREKVADAARDLFSRYGFHATGIAQIAEASGIKVQQIYRDFCNKEGIVEVIVASDVGKLFAEVSQISNRASDGRGALREWLRQMLLPVTAEDHPPLFLEIFAEASRNPRIAAILQEIDLQVRAAVVEAFSAFAGPGTAASDLSVAADLFLTFVCGLSERRVAHPGADTERLTDIICRMIDLQIGTGPVSPGSLEPSPAC